MLDFGGILDDNPNIEAAADSSSVVANYYAEGYAAYLFLRRYQRSGEEEWRQAAVDALYFLARSYDRYPTGLTWSPHEFKNAAFLECILLLEDLGEEVPGALRGLIDRLRVDRYEPTNVFALRLHWKVLHAGSSAGRRDEGRLQMCRERLLRDTTVDGLIRDENPPAYVGARDLTYHQYSLACLAGALAVEDDPTLRDLFLRGCAFSRAVLLPNGEPSYNGRGANNIYHVASTILAFSFARNRYGFESQGEGEMLSLLEGALLADGSLPTALNDYPEERMGWNHCRSPYNALTGFLLLKACDEMGGATLPVSPKSSDLLASGYSVFQNRGYAVTVFSGLSESYAYSGANRTGVSGLAAVVPAGRAPLNLILNRTLRDGGVLVTDLATIWLGDTAYEPIGGRLAREGGELVWSMETEAFRFTRTYRFRESWMEVESFLEARRDLEPRVERWMAFPLHTDSYDATEREDELLFHDRKGTLVATLCPVLPHALSGSWQRQEVPSNPRGKGAILHRELRPGRLKAGETRREAWRLCFETL